MERLGVTVSRDRAHRTNVPVKAAPSKPSKSLRILAARCAPAHGLIAVSKFRMSGEAGELLITLPIQSHHPPMPLLWLLAGYRIPQKLLRLRPRPGSSVRVFPALFSLPSA